MNMTKKKTTLLALTLIAVFFTGMVAAQVLLPPRYIYVTVEEAISITPEAFTIELTYPGQTENAEFTVSNLANVLIPLIISAEVTTVPEGGNAADVTLAYPETLSVDPGDTTLTITITFATGAVPGDYAVTLGVTRV